MHGKENKRYKPQFSTYSNDCWFSESDWGGAGGSFMLKARILAITDSFNQTEQKRSVFSRGRRLDEACLPGYTLDPFQVLDELLQRVLKICDDIKDM